VLSNDNQKKKERPQNHPFKPLYLNLYPKSLSTHFFFFYISPKAKKREKMHSFIVGFYVKFCAQKIPTHFFFST